MAIMMGDGLTGGYWLEGTVVTGCRDEPNGPDAQSQKEPSCSAVFDPPKDWNCVAGSTQAGLATRRGPITRPGQHSPVMRNPTQVTTQVSWGCTLYPTSGLVPIAGTQSRAHALSHYPNLRAGALEQLT